MTQKIPVITLDGPSGVGKGTLSKMLSEHLKWNYLDSGAIYRALALSAINHNIDFEDEKSISLLATHLDIKFTKDKLILEGEDITNQIRLPKCSQYATKIATMKYVREGLIERQRNFKEAPGLIADGRDMGTVIFQDADLKFFITANIETRIKRRYEQLLKQGIKIELPQIAENIKNRDLSDTTRKNSPLKPADTAIIIDNTNKTPQECFQICINAIKKI